MKKQATSLILALLMLSSSLLSCSQTTENAADETTGNNGTDTSISAQESETEPAEEETVTDDLPERNYNDFDFWINGRETTANVEWISEEITGEPLYDALFERKGRMEERFGIVLHETILKDSKEAFTIIQSGDQTYSLFNTPCTYAAEMGKDAMCFDIASMPYIDLDKPYWDNELSLAINYGKNIFTAIGMSNLTAIDFLTVLMFNKSIVEQYQIENLYTAVREGTWTFDKMGELGALVTDDINGDGNLNGQDQYGVLGGTKYLHCSFIPAGNAWYITKDEENYPVFTMRNDEHIHNVYEKTLQILNDNGAWYHTSDMTNEQTENCSMFRNGQGLFLGHQIYFVASMRDMEDDFGLLPYPKFDEEQAHYYSRLCFYDTTIIPITAADPECSSIILEAITCDSFNNLIPVYREQLLKSKFVRDADSAEMFDLMVEHRIADMGDSIYYPQIRDGMMAQMFLNSDRSLASAVKSKQKLMEKTLSEINKAYKEK